MKEMMFKLRELVDVRWNEFCKQFAEIRCHAYLVTEFCLSLQVDVLKIPIFTKNILSIENYFKN